MMRRLIRWTPALCLIIIALSACQPAPLDISDPLGYVPVGADSAIEIGVIVVADDPAYSEISEAMLRGAELAAREYNEVAGYPIQIVAASETCEAQEQASRAIAVRAGIVAVVGHVCEPSCSIAVPLYEESRLTLVSPACNSSVLTDRILHSPSFLRTIPPASRSTQLTAEFAYSELGARRAGILTIDTSSTENAEDFATAFQALGGSIAAQINTTGDRAALQTALSEMMAAGADVVYVEGQPDSVQRLAGVRDDAGNAAFPMLTIAPITTQWYLGGEPGTLENIFAAAPRVSGSQWESFSQTYERSYGSVPSVYAALTYDSVMMVLDSIAVVGQDFRGQALYIGHGLLRNELYRTAARPAVSGTLTCTTWGDCAGVSLAMYSASPDGWDLVYAP